MFVIAVGMKKELSLIKEIGIGVNIKVLISTLNVTNQ
jgi:hypothetical protein